MKKSIVLFINFFSISFLFAQLDCLDIGFGNEGKVTTPIGTQEDIGNSVVIQPDENLIVAGYSKNGTNFEIALVRYKNNGDLDPDFGIGGIVTTDIGTGSDIARSLALQADEKIVVIGYSYYTGSDSDIALIRYNSDGSLDNNFGINGKVMTDFNGYNDYGNSLAIGDDEKIIVTGNSISPNQSSDFIIVRYLPDGSLDSIFGINGKVVIDFGDFDYAYKVILQPDGKIVIVGQADNPSDHDFFICRLDEIGNLDNSFGQGGIVTTDFGDFDDKAVSAILQPDNKIIVVGGVPDNLFTSPFMIARYNVNGSLDNTFGIGGKVTTDFDNETQRSDMAWSVALQSDGKIVVAGDSGGKFALARYNVDGSLDNSYCSGGKVITAVGDIIHAGAKSVLIQSDNKIVSAGYAGFSGQGLGKFALVRYLPSINLDVVNIFSNINSVSIYPNPVQQNTILEYTLVHQEKVSIYLIDIWGQKVITFIENQKQEAATHQQSIVIPEDIPLGLYNIVISTTSGQANIKVAKCNNF